MMYETIGRNISFFCICSFKSFQNLMHVFANEKPKIHVSLLVASTQKLNIKRLIFHNLGRPAVLGNGLHDLSAVLLPLLLPVQSHHDVGVAGVEYCFTCKVKSKLLKTNDSQWLRVMVLGHTSVTVST